MSWSFRELLSRSLFRSPPLHSRRREATDNRGTGVQANRDFSPRSRSSPNTEAQNTGKVAACSDVVPRASVNPRYRVCVFLVLLLLFVLWLGGVV